MDCEAIRLVPRGHVFATNEFGKIDMWASESGDFHNGPLCVICNESFCHHCSDAWKTELCPRHQEELPGFEFAIVGEDA